MKFCRVAALRQKEFKKSTFNLSSKSSNLLANKSPLSKIYHFCLSAIVSLDIYVLVKSPKNTHCHVKYG